MLANFTVNYYLKSFHSVTNCIAQSSCYAYQYIHIKSRGNQTTDHDFNPYVHSYRSMLISAVFVSCHFFIKKKKKKKEVISAILPGPTILGKVLERVHVK